MIPQLGQAEARIRLKGFLQVLQSLDVFPHLNPNLHLAADANWNEKRFKDSGEIVMGVDVYSFSFQKKKNVCLCLL